MANYKILNKFSHITQHINEPIAAMVSVQYPELSAWESFKDSFYGIFKQKRVTYIVLTNDNLYHIQTLGSSIDSKKTLPLSTVSAVALAKERVNTLEFPVLNITTESKTEITKKGKKEEKIREKSFTFTLFPSLFFSNLEYSEKPQEILEMVSMRGTLVNFFENLKERIDKTSTVAFV